MKYQYLLPIVMLLMLDFSAFAEEAPQALPDKLPQSDVILTQDADKKDDPTADKVIYAVDIDQRIKALEVEQQKIVNQHNDFAKKLDFLKAKFIENASAIKTLKDLKAPDNEKN